jgi:phage/plasmid-associated DNA primase
MYSMVDHMICAKTYSIPDNKISKMFKYIECCRRTNAIMMMYEKQNEYSGIMLDFDICQQQSKSLLTHEILQVVCLTTLNLIKKYVNLENPNVPYTGKTFDTYIAITKKPSVKQTADKKYYKEGFHVLIPGIQVTREVKKFLIKKIFEDEIFRTTFNMITCVEKEDGSFYSYLDFVDKNSAHVPVFFLGSRSKIGSEAYVLESVNILTTTISELSDPRDSGISTVTQCDKFNANDSLNPTVLSHELSLNWETAENDGKGVSIIKKRKYEIKEQYLTEVNMLKSDNKESSEPEEHGALSILHIHDPDIQYIEDLLNTLDASRYTDFGEWFKVLCVLAHANTSYKPLAEAFSMKSVEKFNQIDFENHWQSASTNKKNKLNMGSLHYWAKLDNPVKYEEVRQRSIYTIVYKKVYDTQLDGSLQHYDIAKILFISLRHKYAFDTNDGGMWYEFILQEDPHKAGEIYKWRMYNKAPSSIKMYTSEILPKLFNKVLDKIELTLEGLKGDDYAKYHNMVKNNLKVTCRRLRDNGFKNGVAKECEQVFEKINFSSSLDKDPEILGVGNGILKLGSEVQFITGYHNYSVSQYTAVNYTEYNPNNPITKKLLIAIRNLFPDDEPDTFEFMMHYFASALDGKKKESLLLLLVGNGSNGKSFLVELFKETIGSMYAVKMPLSFLTSRPKNSESATPALMMLVTARFAYYSETEKSEVLHLAKVKELTGQETLGGRGLFGDYKTFKPTCHHLVTSNYDFAVNGNDHGTWRRLKRVTMRIKFCKANVDNYNENNPHERIADASMGAKWPDDPEVQSAFLSILCHYYESLQNKYDGVVENVPHPNIKAETEAFRDRQDKINNFINIRFVKTVDTTYQVTMAIIIEKYSKWYDSLYPDDKEYKKSISSQFENSKLSKIFEKTRTDVFIRGYRILDAGEEPEEDEIFFIDVFSPVKKNTAVVNVSETAEQFHERLCNEYQRDQTALANRYKKEARDSHDKKMQVIKNTPKIIIKQRPVFKSIKSISSINETHYNASGFKKKNIAELPANDLKDMAGSDSDSD